MRRRVRILILANCLLCAVLVALLYWQVDWMVNRYLLPDDYANEMCDTLLRLSYWAETLGPDDFTKKVLAECEAVKVADFSGENVTRLFERIESPPSIPRDWLCDKVKGARIERLQIYWLPPLVDEYAGYLLVRYLADGEMQDVVISYDWEDRLGRLIRRETK